MTCNVFVLSRYICVVVCSWLSIQFRVLKQKWLKVQFVAYIQATVFPKTTLKESEIGRNREKCVNDTYMMHPIDVKHYWNKISEKVKQDLAEYSNNMTHNLDAVK